LKEKIFFSTSINHHDQNSFYGTTSYQAEQLIGFGQLHWDKKIGKHDFILGAAIRYTDYDDDTPATESNDKSIKIILVSAEWCQVCSKTKRLIQDSEDINQLLSKSIRLYEFDIEQEESITLNNSTFHFIPTGLKTGEHEFTTFLFNKGEKVSVPSIVIINNENKIIQRFQGYLNEEEWVALLTNLER